MRNSIQERAKRLHISWAYKRFIGPIPKGMKCCHSCDDTECVNPYHLFLGSQSDNIKDAKRKGRMPSWKERGGTCPAILGAMRGKRKLTIEKVLEAQKRYLAGETQTSLAKEFGVDQSTMSVAVRNKTWKFAHAKSHKA